MVTELANPAAAPLTAVAVLDPKAEDEPLGDGAWAVSGLGEPTEPVPVAGLAGVLVAEPGPDDDQSERE